MRAGGCCQLQSKILLFGLSAADLNIREQASEQFIGFLTSHIASSVDATHDTEAEHICKFANYIAHRAFVMIGSLHELYM
jgi:hypothetical protein